MTGGQCSIDALRRDQVRAALNRAGGRVNLIDNHGMEGDELGLERLGDITDLFHAERPREEVQRDPFVVRGVAGRKCQWIE